MSKKKSIFMLFLLLVVTLLMSSILAFGIGDKNIGKITNIKQGLDLKGGVSVTYEAMAENPTQEQMDATVSLLRGRLDSMGYTEATVVQQGDNRVTVEVPGVENAQQVVDELGQTAQLYFMDSNGNILLTGDEVANAEKQSIVDANGIPQVVVALEFTEEGTVDFANATANNIGLPIYIMLDDQVISAPIVNQEISDGQAIITGNFTIEEATQLADLINAGALPFDLEVVQRQEVGATLGEDALRSSILAGVIGVILVMLFMIIQYRILGFAADIALFIFIVLELLCLSLLGITLSLAGIAGIILSIGMAVDANIIIFERIREEVEQGTGLRKSVKSGFSRALPAIVDGNITTLIAAFILFYVGSGPIKGFAQTLTIGIIVSMFTALILTRFIVSNFIGVGLSKSKMYRVKAGGEAK